MVNVKGFSPRYTAPEVFGRLTANLTNASIEDEMKGDVYSYAVILWEMMARKSPWANCMFFSFFLSHLIDFQNEKLKKNVVKEIDEINFQVQSGEREEIPNSNGDQNLELISSLIELSWKQIPDERPHFNHIDQKLSSLTC